MGESSTPFDRWHTKRRPKPEDLPCRCGTRKSPLYPSGDHGRGQRWQARYTDPEGRRRKPGFDVWQDAQDHLDKVALAIRANTWVDPEIGKKRVEFFAAQYLQRRRDKDLDAGSTGTYSSHIRNHILPFMGKREAQTLKRRDTMAMVDHLIKTVDSSATIRGIFKTWRILVHYMMDEDVPLPANTCSRITLPELKGRAPVAFSPEEVCRVALAMRQVEPRYEILIWIAACAGLRLGEALGLRTTSVGWEEDLLIVVEQRQGGKAKRLKTKASRVTLPVDHFLIELLADHVQRFPRAAEATPRAHRRRKYPEAPDEALVVTNRFGRPVQRQEFNKKWNRAKEIAGLDKDARYHDLKRFYTSRIGSSGHHDPKTTQALSRHASFSETWDTYARPPQAVEGVTIRTFSDAFIPMAESHVPAVVATLQGYDRNGHGVDTDVRVWLST
ncbi:tyrosine recombinase XerC [Streptacidiphilus sp. N1-3]|uniref:Tyrosine recombinase XerC n=1 Tax=Streptacidiphilus alkalitolerans TaxID=3342712 RepID=A0ABV6XBF8_9ACTN